MSVYSSYCLTSNEQVLLFNDISTRNTASSYSLSLSSLFSSLLVCNKSRISFPVILGQKRRRIEEKKWEKMDVKCVLVLRLLIHLDSPLLASSFFLHLLSSSLFFSLLSLLQRILNPLFDYSISCDVLSILLYFLSCLSFILIHVLSIEFPSVESFIQTLFSCFHPGFVFQADLVLSSWHLYLLLSFSNDEEFQNSFSLFVSLGTK